MHIRHVPKIIEREEENCYLLINRRNGQKLVLNESSFYVWKLCEDSTVEDVIKKVVEEFNLDEKEAEEEITNAIETLYQKGLIEMEE
jgi:predicted deacetylase